MSIAQLTSPEDGINPYIPTWDTYEFMKYGTVGSSLYTGTVNYSVPIFMYEDEDFNYSVSVDYATNGFVVNHKSGLLGHGWSLSHPGMVTREIYGLADEGSKTVMALGGNGVQLVGYNSMPNASLNGCVLVHYDNTRAFTALTDDKGFCYDAQPDIYRFNFSGHSGSFRRIPSESGAPSFLFFDCLSNSQSLRIENFTSDNRIVIADGDGYKYTFTVGEYTKGTYSDAINQILENRNRQWNLQKITAPNGRKMEFVYNHISDYGSLDKSNNNVTYTPSLSYEFSYFGGVDYGHSSKDVAIYESNIYSTRLTGIIFPDSTRVRIEYADGIKELRYIYPNGQTKEADGEHKRINSIKVYSAKGSLIKKASFSYKTVGGDSDKENKVTFLSSIDVSGQGVFSFEYNPMTAYPPLGTIKSDHWGYYNGETGGFATQDIFSNLIFDTRYNERYASVFNRNPNYQAALSGTLRRITYPTGGFSILSYEQHDCSKKVVRTDSSLFLPELVSLSDNENVGGVRIRQVETYQSDGTPVDTVRYEYQSAGNPRLSSGILINTPRYGIKYVANGIKAVERFNLCNGIYDFTKTHIEYSHVREFKSEAGYTDFFYTNYEDFPDGVDGIEEDKSHRLNLFGYYNNGYNIVMAQFTNPDNLVTNILTPIASSQTKRGLLSEIKKYNADGVQVGGTKYNYSFPMVKMDTVLTLTGDIARDVFYPRYNIELRSVEESVIYGNIAVSNTKTSRFNSFGLETKSESTTSEGYVVVDEYQYSGDVGNADGVVRQMQLAHNVNSPLMHERTVLIDGEEHAISKTRYNYCRPHGGDSALFKVSSVEVWSPADGWSVKGSFLYDDYGRVKQQTDTSGVHTAYLWGYKGRYPLLMARNASFSQVEQALSAKGLFASNLANATDYDDDTFGKLLALGNDLPLSFVEVFRFKPNFGLTEHSLPNSLRTFYNYDGYGCLTSIADSERHIVEQREYNLVSIAPMDASMACPDLYINEPANISATASGGTGSYQYVYKVYDIPGGNVVYEETNSGGILNIIPSEAGLVSDNYRIQCEVSDLISGEKELLDQEVYVKPVKLCFSGISDNGNGVVSAFIYSDTPTEVTFGLELVSTNSCAVSIAESSFTYTREKDAELTVPLSAGDNLVTISYPPSTVIFEATLWMKSATNGHEIGEPGFIYVSH